MDIDEERERLRRILLGIGTDGKDGHSRLTKGKNFFLLGGSEKTHAKMQDTAMAINEELAHRNTSLDDAPEELIREIVNKVKK